MILRDIRDRVWAAADYAPAGSPEGVIRTRQFINRALMRLVMDAPFLFEKEVIFFIDPDVLPDATSSVEDSWRSTTSPFDPWVLESTWTDATAPTLFARFIDPERPFNGRWIEFKDPSDSTGKRIQRHRIREVFSEGEEGGRTIQISLFEPVTHDTPGYAPTGGGGVGVITDWRITMVQHALPADLVSVEAIQVYDSLDNFVDFRYMTAHEAVRYGYDAAYWNSPTASHPWVCWPGEIETIPVYVPTDAPAYFLTGSAWGTSITDEPRGKFEYLYTLSLGHRHDEIQDVNPVASTSLVANVAGRRLPYLESPPTAYTDLIDPSTFEISIDLPDLNVLYGFGNGATHRYAHTGLHVNIYRRRVEHDTPPTGVVYDGYPRSNHFQHVHTEALSTGVLWTDDGSSVPGRRLKRVGAYKTLRFSPSSDERYRVHVRAVVRPEEMLDDGDTCNIPPSAIDALLFLALRNLYEASGNPAMAANSFRDYERALHALKKRHASLKSSGESWKMRPRSSRRRRSVHRHYQVVDTP